MGSSGRLCHPKGSSRKARLTRTGLRCEWTLPQRRLTMASRGESGKPTRHCRLRLALLSVLSPPRTEAGASSPAREAHGHQPNSRHVPSRKSAPESRKTRSDKVFRWALSDGIPYHHGDSGFFVRDDGGTATGTARAPAIIPRPQDTTNNLSRHRDFPRPGIHPSARRTEQPWSTTRSPS